MTQPLLFGDEAAKRDAGTALVLDNAGQDWRDRAREIFHAMPEVEMTGEDIRLACEAEGVKPHHNNAWGAMVLTLVREGFLEQTNEYRPMRAKGSHARKTQVYRRVQA